MGIKSTFPQTSVLDVLFDAGSRQHR